MAATKITLSQAIDEYLADRLARGYAATTVDQAGYVLRRFAVDVGPNIQVKSLTPEHVRRWFYGSGGVGDVHRTRDGRQRRPVKASTQNFYLSRLKLFFVWCRGRGHAARDLTAEVDRAREVRRQRQQPSPHHLLRMLDQATNGRDRAYLATIMNTGLRANEVLRLRVGDVDLAAGWLQVYISKSKQEDSLPISSDLDGELRRWLSTYGVDLGRPLTRDCHLFPARTGPRYRWVASDDGTKSRDQTPPAWVPEKPMTHPERVVKEVMAALGLPTESEGSHTLRRAVARHFFDSRVASGGYDGALRETSALLHHVSSATTEIYLGLSSERERRNQALRGKPFLSAMVDADNLVQLPRRTAAE